MRRNIGSRLQAIRQAGLQKGPPAGKNSHTQEKKIEVVSPGDDWKQVGEYTFIREKVFPNPINLSDWDAYFQCPLFSHLEAKLKPEELVFFDLETTGLSGGPGTAVFLAGFGKLQDKHMTVTQFFMADYPGESEFLSIIRAFLPENPCFVSYNGKSFDAPMLISKGILHRIMFSFPRHIDLLHISRRLWKRLLTSCSLSVIETEILGVSRDIDIPGAMAPEIYFKYLKERRNDEIALIAAHHYEDILSLAKLLSHICMICDNPKGDYKVDYLGLGVLLQQTKEGKDLLYRGFSNGDVKCGTVLSSILKKENDYTEAVPLWQQLVQIYNDIPSAIELAKYYEHKLKDYDSAKNWTEKAQDIARVHRIPLPDDTARRIKRIKTKQKINRKEKY